MISHEALQHGPTDSIKQYWVVFAFLTVFESLVSAVYWFPFYYTFKFIFVLWLALPVTR